MTGQSFFAVVQTFFGVTPALVYLVAGLLIAAGSGTAVTAGTLVAFTTLQARLLFPPVQLLRVSLDVQTSLALFRRIFEYLDLRPRIVERPDARPLDPAAVQRSGRVRGRLVPLPRPGRGRRTVEPARAGRAGWAVRDVSFAVEPGQLAAIVGPSGSGKTTLSYLVPRLYDVDRGRVLIDGHDVRDLTLASLADAVGMVTQETYLLHTTDRGTTSLRQAGRHPGRDRGGGAGREHPRPDRRASPRATTPSSASAATGSPAGRSSGWPSPGCCSRTRAS